MGEDAAVEAAGRAQVDVLDAGGMAQGCELQPGSEAAGVALGGFAVDEQAGALLEGHDLAGRGAALIVERPGHAGQAEGDEAVAGGMGKHDSFSMGVALAVDVGVAQPRIVPEARLRRDDPALRHQHRRLDLGLVAGPARPGLRHRHAVVLGHGGHGAVEPRLKTVPGDDDCARVVRHDHARHAAEEGEQVDLRADPVLQRLRRPRLGVV